LFTSHSRDYLINAIYIVVHLRHLYDLKPKLLLGLYYISHTSKAKHFFVVSYSYINTESKISKIMQTKCIYSIDYNYFTITVFNARHYKEVRIDFCSVVISFNFQNVWRSTLLLWATLKGSRAKCLRPLTYMEKWNQHVMLCIFSI